MEAVEDTSEKFQGSIVKMLESAIGAENVKTSKFERLLYSHDLAPLPKESQIAFKNIPDIVVRPRSTEDVQKVVKIASAQGTPITPRGAATWGLAGSTPAYGGILIDMTAMMNKIVKIDEINIDRDRSGGCIMEAGLRCMLGKGIPSWFISQQFPQCLSGRMDIHERDRYREL